MGHKAQFKMSNYDLTSAFAPYLDKHLLFPLLEFLQAQKIHPEKDVLESKLDLLKQTNMVDFATDVFKQLNPGQDIPEDLKTKRTNVINQVKALKEECAPLVNLVEQPDVVSRLKRNKDLHMAFLAHNYGVTDKHLDALYRYARCLFECGQYDKASSFLSHFRSLSSDAEKNKNALWGRLASNILIQKWREALKDVNSLKELIDNKSSATPVEQMNQRAWLLHWSLFVYFNISNGDALLIELFTQDKYMQAIHTLCPHLLRYLTTAVIVSSRRRQLLRDLVRVLQTSDDSPAITVSEKKEDDGSTKFDVSINGTTDTTNPISTFVRRLYVSLDFASAHKELDQCNDLFNADFFLIARREEFVENARLFMFETYCRIHSCIDISTLAGKLNMPDDVAEKWIVNMIRDARLDAKIDSANNTIVMGSRSVTPYQRVIDKTKGLSFRSHVLVNNIHQLHNAKQKMAAAAKAQAEAVAQQAN